MKNYRQFGSFFKKSPHIFTNLVKNESDFLRQPAKLVTFPLDGEIHKVIEKMKKLSQARNDFAGIAAPQIGVSLQLFAFKIDHEVAELEPDTTAMQFTVMINPEYIPIKAEGQSKDWESCYSVPDLLAEVYRYNQVRYKAYDQNGELKEGLAKGFLAKIIQHETDHLHGKLMIDRVTKGCRMGPREKYEPILYHEYMEKLERRAKKT